MKCPICEDVDMVRIDYGITYPDIRMKCQVCGTVEWLV